MALCPPHCATCDESRRRGPRTRTRHSDATRTMVRPPSTPWRSLGLSAGELKLAHTLPTGQAFGWRRSGDEYHGVLGDAAVAVRRAPRVARIVTFDEADGPVLSCCRDGGPDAHHAAAYYYNVVLHGLRSAQPLCCQCCERRGRGAESEEDVHCSCSLRRQQMA